MAHIVAEPCFDCKYTDCVVVCPVDCFYEGAQMLYIHPEECIDCEACVPECPVEAIFHEDNLPDEWKDFTALNAEEVAASARSSTRRKTRSKANRATSPEEEVSRSPRTSRSARSRIFRDHPAPESPPGSLREPRFGVIQTRLRADPPPPGFSDICQQPLDLRATGHEDEKEERCGGSSPS